MAEAAIISWTPSNWITVVLMVAVTFLIVGSAARIVQQRAQSKNAGG